MLPFALVGGGAVVLWTTFIAARRTRRARQPAVRPPVEDTWPIELDDQAPGHTRRPVRLWPVAGSLAGLLLITGGLVAAQTERDTVLQSPRPFAIDIPVDTASPDVTAEPSPSPASVSATSTPASKATPRATTAPSAAPRATPKRTAAPTPEPTPVRPGPSINASTSCMNRSAHISYQVNARANTTLTSVSVLLDGRVVQQPKAAGKTTFASSYGQNVSPGDHTFTVVARGSDGGSASKSYGVC
jgi:hypothetical protein